MTNGDLVHTLPNTSGTGSTQQRTAPPSDPTTLVDGTAAFYAHYQRLVVENELSNARPDGGVRHLLVAAVDDDRVAYELNVPEDPVARRGYCYEMLDDLAHEVPLAAVMSCTCASQRTGGETVLVFASDHSGGSEAWAADVTRADGQPPSIGEWERVALGGAYVFMLHLAVGNYAGMREQAEAEGIPPAFLPRLQSMIA